MGATRMYHAPTPASTGRHGWVPYWGRGKKWHIVFRKETPRSLLYYCRLSALADTLIRDSIGPNLLAVLRPAVDAFSTFALRECAHHLGCLL